jgi:uncharacterized protein (DUF1778 family)
MAESANVRSKEDRLSIRATPSQKAVLAQAARARHTTVSQFVLETAVRAAHQVVEEETLLRVSAEEYAWLSKTMDEAVLAPRLREALGQPPVWDVEP